MESSVYWFTIHSVYRTAVRDWWTIQLIGLIWFAQIGRHIICIFFFIFSFHRVREYLLEAHFKKNEAQKTTVFLYVTLMISIAGGDFHSGTVVNQSAGKKFRCCFLYLFFSYSCCFRAAVCPHLSDFGIVEDCGYGERSVGKRKRPNAPRQRLNEDIFIDAWSFCVG